MCKILRHSAQKIQLKDENLIIYCGGWAARMWKKEVNEAGLKMGSHSEVASLPWHLLPGQLHRRLAAQQLSLLIQF